MPVRALLNIVARKPLTHKVPEGRRIYAVGDIHGRLDLLDELLGKIDSDAAMRGPSETMIIFLGDLVDRGPNSRGVVERLLDFRDNGRPCRFLMGNHEEIFLKALRGERGAMRFFVRIGGRETIASYGVSDHEYRTLGFDELTELLRERVPAEHVKFLSSFEEWFEVGDYLFVHAGIRPGVELDAQSAADLHWIRDDFLLHRDSFGKIVVHGHTITDDIDVRSTRIGIDTGAYASGRLTAIGLEASERWFLST